MFTRTQQLQHLMLASAGCDFLPIGLRHVDLVGTWLDDRCLAALAKCQHIQTLSLTRVGYAVRSDVTVLWPDLRFLHITHCEEPLLDCLQCAPQLQLLCLTDMCLEEVSPALARSPRVHCLKLHHCLLADDHTVGKLAVEVAELFDVEPDSMQALPRSLVSLRLESMQVPDSFLHSHFTALRSLFLRIDSDTMEKVVVALNGSLLPALDSLTIEAIVRGYEQCDRQLFPSLRSLVVHTALPKLAQLRMIFVFRRGAPQQTLIDRWLKTMRLHGRKQLENLAGKRSGLKVTAAASWRVRTITSSATVDLTWSSEEIFP